MRFILAIAAVMIGILMTGNASIQFAQTSRLPEQLSDQEFWRLITDLSEPSGSYTATTGSPMKRVSRTSFRH